MWNNEVGNQPFQDCVVLIWGATVIGSINFLWNSLWNWLNKLEIARNRTRANSGMSTEQKQFTQMGHQHGV